MFTITEEQSQICKGIAILLVIVTHYFGSVNSSIWLPVPFSAINIPFSGIGVFLFLFLSGYGLMASYLRNRESYLKTYLGKRVLKLMAPYWTVMIPFVVICFLSGRFRESPLHTAIYLLGLDCGWHFDTSMWFISYIIYWYSVFYFFMKLEYGYHDVAKLIFIPAIIISVTILVLIYPHSARIYALAFPSGALLVNQKIPNHKYLLWFFGIYSILQVFYARFQQTLIYFWIYYFVFSMIIIFLVKQIKKHCIILTFLGKISFELYLIEGILFFYSGIFSVLGTGLTGAIIFDILLILMALIIQKTVRAMIRSIQKESA